MCRDRILWACKYIREKEVVVLVKESKRKIKGRENETEIEKKSHTYSKKRDDRINKLMQEERP